MALASLYSHARAGLKEGSSAVNDRFTVAKSCIPYYNVKVKSAEQERKDAAEMYALLNKHYKEIVARRAKDTKVGA